MLRDGKIKLGEFNLSVAADRPPAAYSQLSSDVALPNLKWIDGHKPVFRVNVSMVSSIHPKVRGQMYLSPANAPLSWDQQYSLSAQCTCTCMYLWVCMQQCIEL